MSDLDQAIREHLALKRLHGADPGEVARQEREAFGEPSPERAAEFAAAYSPEVYAGFAAHVPAQPEEKPRLREKHAVPTNEYARANLLASLEGGEATQEYTIEDQLGWRGGPLWQGGAA